LSHASGGDGYFTGEVIGVPFCTGGTVLGTDEGVPKLEEFLPRLGAKFSENVLNGLFSLAVRLKQSLLLVPRPGAWPASAAQ
jgi:hypothetical protein